MKNWPSFPRRFTKAKIFLKPALFTVGLIIVLIPAYFQQISLTNVYKGIEIRSGTINMDLNFSKPQDIYFIFPYRIINSGFYELEDIQISITLKLNYTNKNTQEKIQSIILQETEGAFFLKVGNDLSDTLYRNYSSFNWGNIGEFVIEGDNFKVITLLMDILIIFFMSWVERD